MTGGQTFTQDFLRPERVATMDDSDMRGEVGEMERAGQACGSGADDEDVGFELFTLHGHGMR